MVTPYFSTGRKLEIDFPGKMTNDGVFRHLHLCAGFQRDVSLMVEGAELEWMIVICVEFHKDFNLVSDLPLGLGFVF